MEWIDVKKKMPEIEKKYGYKCICYFLSYSIDRRDYRNIDFLLYSNGKFYRNYIAIGNEVEITHWMPIPKPPKIKK